MSGPLIGWHDERAPAARPAPADLADILERVLNTGVVVAGDIRISLLDIELLTIRLRLLVTSVDKAREMGIDWWEHDPSLTSAARRRALRDAVTPPGETPVDNAGSAPIGDAPEALP
ncbi:gas vesicle protein GvpA/GvpJ/GvpM family [Krasilnikovia cinnamomea]|uniref:Gas vesicle protein GvpA/GvpJ/GvpM family n=1 Tax=Krasilnikovia cinnamomea TaxID=349313 RepID=A0A4Q7ZTS3_9ACTN|nr:gas vesicle protein [Krasilnikovia cinnamomea]RZU54003.1 gas vesicle protein GvpA/GvpJ/GvpM family [Krasilnikovia cinnamomea]